MAHEGFKRELAVFPGTWDTGCSQCTKVNDTATIMMISTCRKIIASPIKNRRHRFMNSQRVHLAVESSRFVQGVEPVKGAVTAQVAITASSSELVENREMNFQFSINSGGYLDEKTY